MRVNKSMNDTLRFQIIEEYLSGSSQYWLAKKYNLKSKGCIKRWVRIFGIEESPNLTAMSKRQTTKESEELLALKQELKRVKADLAFQRMRADAFETMIELTEEDLNISIRKKDGTKP